MSAPSLYHLSADLAALEALLADANEQDETVNDVAVVAAWIAELEGIAEVLTRMGVKKVDTDVSTFSMAKAGGKDPVVVDDGVDLATLPADCVKTTLSPVKDAIRAHIEAGEVVAGCRIQERGLVLRVK